jgi:hypothetical protein
MAFFEYDDSAESLSSKCNPIKDAMNKVKAMVVTMFLFCFLIIAAPTRFKGIEKTDIVCSTSSPSLDPKQLKFCGLMLEGKLLIRSIVSITHVYSNLECTKQRTI